MGMEGSGRTHASKRCQSIEELHPQSCTSCVFWIQSQGYSRWVLVWKQDQATHSIGRPNSDATEGCKIVQTWNMAEQCGDSGLHLLPKQCCKSYGHIILVPITSRHDATDGITQPCLRNIFFLNAPSGENVHEGPIYEIQTCGVSNQ
jgi:hypothetical protein